MKKRCCGSYSLPLCLLASSRLQAPLHIFGLPCTMASSSTSLSAYLFQRIKADLDYLHSQSLLDSGARDAIVLQLDAAAARSGSTHGGVPALSNQLSGVSFAPSPSPQPSNLSGPPAPPARHEEHHDSRDRARALWNYAAT